MSRILCGIVGVALGAGLASGAASLGWLPHAAHGPADPHDHGGHEGHDHGESAPAGDPNRVVLTPEAMLTFGIRIESAEMRFLQPVLEVPARVSFDRDALAHVGSPLRGRVADIAVRVGDAVQKGDRLLTIESPELGEAQVEFLRRRAALAAAAPTLDLAKAAHERARGLWKGDGGVSLSEVQAREADVKTAEAVLELARAEVVAGEARLHVLGMAPEAVSEMAASGRVSSALDVGAPVAGEIVARDVTLGEVVGPERDALLTVADPSSFWVLAEVPEASLSEMALGASASLALPGGAETGLGGTIALVPRSVDPSTRTGRVRIEVLAPSGALRDGLFVTARIALGGATASESVLAIPEIAVQTIEGTPTVFVAAAEGGDAAFELRRVAVGRPVGGLVPVLVGLTDGERLVTEGSFLLKAEWGKASAKHEH
ncbi:MAG: efflux RND transporter periplasmic adaptor subunit [Planctomycetales bacterium]|nr:efflux RND transporter periplasmic adaptor subunit [Planctomycetales bacterium]